MSELITIRNLSKRFTVRKFLGQKEKTITALSNINISILKNECFCLLGPNAAGKTTLLKILSSLILADEGKIMISGYDLETQNQSAKLKIGFLNSQERSFYWRLTGRQNLDFFARFYNLSPEIAKKRINQLSITFNIADMLNDRFQQYSSGIKQKFSLIRSLLHDPEILLMDEPTKSLDPRATEELKGFIKENLIQKQNKTVIFATHDIQEAESLSNRIAILDKGKIKITAKPDEIKIKAGANCASFYDAFSYFTENNKRN